VIGDDGSEAAEGAGELAAGIGRLLGATVILVRFYPKLPEVDIEGREFDARMVDDELRREERKLSERATHGYRRLGESGPRSASPPATPQPASWKLRRRETPPRKR
jgi:hypothetical protein